jgi:hypothetical protein
MRTETEITSRLKKKTSLINLLLFCMIRLVWG